MQMDWLWRNNRQVVKSVGAVEGSPLFLRTGRRWRRAVRRILRILHERDEVGLLMDEKFIEASSTDAQPLAWRFSFVS